MIIQDVRFFGTLRDLHTHPIAWPKSPAQIEFEKTLHEEAMALQLQALKSTHKAGEIGDDDYWRLRLELENDQA